MIAVVPTPEDARAAAGESVHKLQAALSKGSGALESVARALIEVLRTEAWRERLVRGRVVRFDRFREFIAAPAPEGLGSQLFRVQAIVADDPDALVMIRRAIKGQPAAIPASDDVVEADRADNVRDSDAEEPDNVRSGPKETALEGHGNAKAYALERLGRERPDIYAQVKDGELSAHAGMVAAGFRKGPDVLAELKRAWRKASAEERAAFAAWLQGGAQ